MKAPSLQELGLDWGHVQFSVSRFENKLSKMLNIIIIIITLLLLYGRGDIAQHYYYMVKIRIIVRTMCKERSNDETYKTRCDV